jgi:hypothetical protein
MILQLSGERKIEDGRGHGPEIVSELRKLLARGVYATPDPSRPGVYDGRRVFFIYVSPASGNVTLLATWREESGQKGEKVSACRVFAALPTQHRAYPSQLYFTSEG